MDETGDLFSQFIPASLGGDHSERKNQSGFQVSLSLMKKCLCYAVRGSLVCGSSEEKTLLASTPCSHWPFSSLKPGLGDRWRLSHDAAGKCGQGKPCCCRLSGILAESGEITPEMGHLPKTVKGMGHHVNSMQVQLGGGGARGVSGLLWDGGNCMVAETCP